MEMMTLADVLIIDDDLDGAEALADLMRAEGHEVRVGYNGQDGLRLARERIPEVALLDVEMPVLDGPGMAYEMLLRDMGLEQVPIVFLSGVANLREVAAAVGTPYFLGKPYRYERVVALVERALSERIAPRPSPLGQP
jgi:DNA-binding NtrC family response regulator